MRGVAGGSLSDPIIGQQFISKTAVSALGWRGWVGWDVLVRACPGSRMGGGGGSGGSGGGAGAWVI